VLVGIFALVNIRQLFELLNNQGMNIVDVMKNVQGSGAGIAESLVGFGGRG
jgi:hypothetical protein